MICLAGLPHLPRALEKESNFGDWDKDKTEKALKLLILFQDLHYLGCLSSIQIICSTILMLLF